MEDWPIIGGVIFTLNWLTITTPFIAGFSAYTWGRQQGEGTVIPAIVGTLAFLGLVAIWYITHLWIDFPLWMRHFD
jgi:hypothetical protein